MSPDNDTRLIEILRAKSGDQKRLPCAEAFKIAGDLDVSLAEIGKACNELGIKVASCQLGCF
jgi:hypothetical protein